MRCPILHAWRSCVRSTRTLKRKGGGLACNCAAPEGLPRATISNHFTILRGAGLIEAHKEGTKVIHQLRRAEIDARFPGLLDAILGAETAA